jgi:hypothetical protein
LTFLHDASIERLNGPDIVRIKLGERVDLLCRDLHWNLQHIPCDVFSAGRSRYRTDVQVIGGGVGQQAGRINLDSRNLFDALRQNMEEALGSGDTRFVINLADDDAAVESFA